MELETTMKMVKFNQKWAALTSIMMLLCSMGAFFIEYTNALIFTMGLAVMLFVEARYWSGIWRANEIYIRRGKKD